MELKISSFKRVVVLTGAGISAESGIRTFRDSDGLWESHRIEDVATPEAFARDPLLVWRFYSLRRLHAAAAEPNPGHKALAAYDALAVKRGQAFTLITQNVDALHERASSNPLVMHGTLPQSRCLGCERIFFDPHSWFDENGRAEPSALTAFPKCPPEMASVELANTQRSNEGIPLSPCCSIPLRPHIVWFGEMPLYMDTIEQALSGCDLFVSIGTSGSVYPAAGFLERAKFAGATTICLNKERLRQMAVVDLYVEGSATQTVPLFFK